MSTCISRHGEFGEHTLDDSYTCTRCHVLDEDALRVELEKLRAALAAVEQDRDKLSDELRDATVELEQAQPVLTAACDVVRVWREWRTRGTGSVIPIKALAAAVDVYALTPIADALAPVPAPLTDLIGIAPDRDGTEAGT